MTAITRLVATRTVLRRFPPGTGAASVGSFNKNCATSMPAIRCLRSFARQALDQHGYGGWQIGGQQFPIGITFEYRRQHIGYVVAIEGALPRWHLIEHSAKRPHVTPFVRCASFRLLRCM